MFDLVLIPILIQAGTLFCYLSFKDCICMKFEEANNYFDSDEFSFLITLVAISGTFACIYFVILMA